MRAPLRLALPQSRTRNAATPDRSDATASRRVAVKSSALGSPQISPITAERPEHLSPSSIAHSASRASRVSTWMRFWVGKPGGWIRPLSRIAIRSCTHSNGLSVATCASRNPTQPPSHGWTAKSSERVGLDGAGRTILPSISRGGGPPKVVEGPLRRAARATSPSNLGEDESAARLAPPATRVRPPATRLTTFLFFFCSYPATRIEESILRLGSLQLMEKLDDFANRGARALLRHRKAHMR